MHLDLKNKTHAIGTRAKHAGRIAKLTMALNAEQEAVQAVCLEIGRLYYETHRDGSDPLLSQLCAEMRASNERIAQLQREMDALRADQD